MLRGFTYFRRWGFSVNEGEFPNVHCSWRDGLFVYVALRPGAVWHRRFGKLP